MSALDTNATYTGELAERLRALARPERIAIHRRCVRHLRAYDAHADGIPILAPLEIPEEALLHGARVTSTVSGLLCRLEEMAMREPALMKRLCRSLEPDSLRFATLLSHESSESRRRRFRRPDGHFAGSLFQLLEMNQIAPQSGVTEDADQLVGAEILNAVGIDYRPKMLTRALVEWLVAEYEFHAADLPRTVAIVSEKGFPNCRADRATCDACEEWSRMIYGQPISFVQAYPHEIRRADDRAVIGEDEIDVIWLQYLDMSKLRLRGVDDAPLIDVLLRATRTVVVNSPRSLLTGSKAALALLGDADIQNMLGFDDAERQLLSSSIPQTIVLETSMGMRAEILANRDAWISKPTDLCEGQGAVFGSSLDDDAWKGLVAARSDPHWVFQRVVRPSRAHVVELTDGGDVKIVDVEFVYGPHFVSGRWTGTGAVRGHFVSEATTDRVLGRGSAYVTIALKQIAGAESL